MSGFTAFSDPKHKPFEFIGENGKIAFLIHGFPGTPYEMRMIGEIIHELNYTVKGLLLPGFGSDIENLNKKRREDWISLIVNEIQKVQTDYKEIILVGYSFGGALSINVLHDYELPITKLILIAPFWNVFGSYPIFIQIIGPLVWPIGRLFSPNFRVFDNIDFDDPEQRKELQGTFEGADIDDPEMRKFIADIKVPFTIIDELYKIGRDGKKKLPKLKQNILVLQGTSDEVVPKRSTDKFLKASKSENVQYITYEEQNHSFIKPEMNNKGNIEHDIKQFIGED